MDEIKKKIAELNEMVTARGGALICFADSRGGAEGVFLHAEGEMNRLALLIGAAALEERDMRDFIFKGVEAAMVAIDNKKKRKYAEA